MKCIYRLVDHETSDTTYDGLRMIVKDTLAIADSTAVQDSIAKPDTLSELQKKARKIESKIIDPAKNLRKIKEYE